MWPHAKIPLDSLPFAGRGTPQLALSSCSAPTNHLRILQQRLADAHQAHGTLNFVLDGSISIGISIAPPQVYRKFSGRRSPSEEPTASDRNRKLGTLARRGGQGESGRYYRQLSRAAAISREFSGVPDSHI